MGSGLLQQGEIQKKLRQRLRRQVPQARAIPTGGPCAVDVADVCCRRGTPRLLPRILKTQTLIDWADFKREA